MSEAYKRPTCKLFPPSRGDSTDVSPFPITCYQHNLSSTRIPTYNPVFLCWRLLGRSHRIASRCVVSICRKLRQRQLYDDPLAPSSLAFRQRRGIAVRIETMRFGGTRAHQYGEGSLLILEETLTTSPTNDLAVRLIN